jgi:hypothetical protein
MWPTVITFEALEGRACAILAERRLADGVYTAFIDSVAPIVLTASGGVSVDSMVALRPKPLAPASGAAFHHYPRRTTVRWAPVPGADHYLLEVQLLGSVYRQSGAEQKYVLIGRQWGLHGDGLHSAKVTRSEATFYFVGAQPGRWRVRAIMVDGFSGEPSPWREFRYTV